MVRKDLCPLILDQNNDTEVIICTKYFQYPHLLVKFDNHSLHCWQSFAYQ